jgi:hypothetical protein
MDPATHTRLTDYEVWAAIQYLDPDWDEAVKEQSRIQQQKYSIRRSRILVVLVWISALAGAWSAWYFDLVPNLLN